MDGKGLHGRNEEQSQTMSPLPLRLRPCHLPPNYDLSGIQVRIEVLGLSKNLVSFFLFQYQHLQLTQPQSEPFLPTDLVPDTPRNANVATECARDLRRQDDQLCGEDFRPSEGQVPRLHG